MMNNTGFLDQEISRILSNVKKQPKARITKSYLVERLNAVKEKYEAIRSFHAKILTLSTSQDRNTYDYFTKNNYDAYLTRFEEAEQHINDQLQKQTETVEPNVQQQVSLSMENRLPELDLPRFDGKHMNWLTFKDQFEAVVHTRTDIPDIRKLQYLRSCLTGEPERLIESFSITTAHYSSAWKTLNDTYNQERLIISQVMNKVSEIRQVHYDNLNSLRYMRDTVRVCINSLAHYEIDIKNQFLVHTLVNKFDSAIRLKWESSTSREAKYPQFATLEKFIADRIQTLQLYSAKPTTNKQRPETRASGAHNATTDRKPNCPCCKNSGHYLYACPEFKEKDPKDRYKLVTENKLCLNCFHPTHFSNKCTSQHRCRTCNKLHHTLLHLNTTNHHTEQKSKRKENTKNHDSTNEDSESEADSINCSHTKTNSNETTLLATAMVKLRSPEGREITAHVMLDTGSEFVNERIVQALKLEKNQLKCR